MEIITDMLDEKGIRPTPNRELVARALYNCDHPVSMAEIEESIASIDKSSVFRVLKLFIDKDLVHVIDDGSGSMRYELCRGEAGHSLNDMHLHFKCVECGRIFCMESQHVPELNLPEGFCLFSVNFVAKGLCDQCATALGTYNSDSHGHTHTPGAK